MLFSACSIHRSLILYDRPDKCSSTLGMVACESAIATVSGGQAECIIYAFMKFLYV